MKTLILYLLLIKNKNIGNKYNIGYFIKYVKLFYKITSFWNCFWTGIIIKY